MPKIRGFQTKLPSPLFYPKSGDPSPLFYPIFLQIVELAKNTYNADLIIDEKILSIHLFGSVQKAKLPQIKEALTSIKKMGYIEAAGSGYYRTDADHFIFKTKFDWITAGDFHLICDSCGSSASKILHYYFVMLSTMYYDKEVGDKTFGHRSRQFFMDACKIGHTTCAKYNKVLQDLGLITILHPFQAGANERRENFYCKRGYEGKLKKYIISQGYNFYED